MTIHIDKTELNKVQVLWKLPNGRNVWWDADVTNVRRNTYRCLKGATATLKYKAAYGYASSSAEVVFLSDVHLREEEGSKNQKLSWRPRHGRGTRSVRASTGKIEKTQQALQQEVAVLRGKLTGTIDKVTVLQRKMELASSLLQPRHNHCAESGAHAEDVLAFLRRKLALLLQKAPRRKPLSPNSEGAEDLYTEGREGITVANVRTNVDCDLRSFEHISRCINTSQCGRTDNVMFSPSYEMTQMPRQGTLSMSIMFSTFADLCHSLGLTSVADRVQMMRTYGTSKGEGVMRLLGTYEVDEEDEKKPTFFFIGRSVGRNPSEENNDEEEACTKFRVLKRATRVWNVVDRRYESSLKIQWLAQRQSNRQPCLVDANKTGFHLAWRKAPDLRKRDWSRCLTNDHVVIGRLEVVLPCLIITGSVLCDEFTSLLTDEVMKDSVQ